MRTKPDDRGLEHSRLRGDFDTGVGASITVPDRVAEARVATFEDVWRRAIGGAPEWSGRLCSLLVVGAHPADEIFGAGGLMRVHALAGCEVTVLSLTDGEVAYAGWRGPQRRRRRELDQALATLAPGKIEAVRLGIPGAQVALHSAIVSEAIHGLIAGKPIIVSPYQRGGHADHEAAGGVCLEVARQCGLTLLRYPVWPWHYETAGEFSNLPWRRVVFDAATTTAKARAIDCLATQLRPTGREPSIPSHVMPYISVPFEAFVI